MEVQTLRSEASCFGAGLGAFTYYDTVPARRVKAAPKATGRASHLGPIIYSLAMSPLGSARLGAVKAGRAG